MTEDEKVETRRLYDGLSQANREAHRAIAKLKRRVQRLTGENGALLALLHDCEGSPRVRRAFSMGDAAEMAMHQALGGHERA